MQREVVINRYGPRPLSPRVSLIVATFNHERYLRDALESATREAAANNGEVIVVDDASTDGTATILEASLSGSRVSVTAVRHRINSGLPAALNTAVAHATGAAFSLLDGDDWWATGAIGRQLAALERDPRIGVAFGDGVVVDAETRQVLRDSFISFFRRVPPPEGEVFLDLLLDGNFIPVSSTTVRRAAFESCGGRFDESLRFQDYDLWLRIAKEWKFAYTGSKDALIRDVPNSMSKTIGVRLFEDYLRIWSKHYGRLPVSIRNRVASNMAHAALNMMDEPGHTRSALAGILRPHALMPLAYLTRISARRWTRRRLLPLRGPNSTGKDSVG